MLHPGKKLNTVDFNVFCTTYLCNGVLRAEVQRPQSHGVQKQRMGAIPENKSGPVKDRKRRNEPDEEHVQALIQKYRCDRGRLNRSSHARRLRSIISCIVMLKYKIDVLPSLSPYQKHRAPPDGCRPRG